MHRSGFVEHFWYLLPHEARGQSHMHGGGDHSHDEADHYIRVNESALLLRGDTLLGDENEECA